MIGPAKRAIALRTAAAHDVPSIVRLWIEANASRCGGVPPDRAVTLATVDLRIGRPDAVFFVAECDGRDAGIGHMLPAADDGEAGAPPPPAVAHVSMIAVRPGLWGRGVGSALMRALVTAASERGYGEMQLWTHAANVRARRLYGRFGFAATGRERPDEYGEPILLLKKTLPARP